MITLPKCELDTTITHAHFYKTDKGTYPSATTILSATKPPDRAASLEQWRFNVGRKLADYILKTSAGVGTGAHLLNEEYLARRYGLDLPVETICNQYKLFAKAHHNNFKPFLETVSDAHVLEQALCSHKMRIAGTIDCVGVVDGKTYIIDYKTKRKPQREEWLNDHYVQAAMYATMWNEHTEPQYHVTGGIIAVSSECETLQIFKVPIERHLNEAYSRIQQYYIEKELGCI